jgi:hypothetical protein
MRRALALLLLAACETSSGSSDPAPAASSSPPTTSPPARVDAGTPHTASAQLRRCAEARAEPSSIVDALARYGALPLPADGPCIVATLPRPLAVVATIGVTSAQPASGRASPRLFFLLPKLVISAVPEGEGSKVLEFGEWVTATRTVKGEIGLPVTAPLAADAAFERVLKGTDRTMCGICHREEERHPTLANAFVSAAYEPEPGTFVTVAELEALHETCAREHDPSDRCAMLHAVFDFGAVTQGAFAPEVETFNGR